MAERIGPHHAQNGAESRAQSPQTGPAGPGGPGGGRFMQKLGTYLLGVAIGLTLLGWFQYQKYQAVRREQARQAAEQQQAPQTDSVAPPTETPATDATSGAEHP